MPDRASIRSVCLAAALAFAFYVTLAAGADRLWQFYLLFLLAGVFGACYCAPRIALVGNWVFTGAGVSIGIVPAGEAVGQGGVPLADASGQGRRSRDPRGAARDVSRYRGVSSQVGPGGGSRPTSPAYCTRRAMRLRLWRSPRVRSSAWIRGAPEVSRDAECTVWMRSSSALSASVRADGGRLTQA